VGIDRPDDPDVPPDKHSDQPAHRAPAETRSHEEYYADLRAAIALRERSDPGARSKPCEQTENDPQAQPGTSWEENAELSRWMWSEYKRRWPPEERPQADRSKDAPGSWHGEGDRVLKPADNERIEVQYDRIADREREKITPALLETEAQDPHRHLIGLDRCLKGRDRIKEKVHDNMKALTISADEALSMVPDAIRYSFQYEEAQYTRGVRTDITRLRDQGFTLDKLKNYWRDDQYKGINSHWIEPDTGQRFEVQFHTRISYEAKQITHDAYERLRTLKTDKFEELVLGAFQKRIASEIPIPVDAVDIHEFPGRVTDAR
jgi:hypothetical protein